MSMQEFDITELGADVCVRTFEVLAVEDGLRLDHYLQRRLHWLSRSAIQKLIASGAVAGVASRFKGPWMKSAAKVAEGDRVEVKVPQVAKDREEAFRDPPLKCLEKLYEDDFLLVINKPAGVPVHPVGINLHRTCLTALHHMYRRPDDPDKDVVPKLVHRLDLETSGTLLVSKGDGILKDLTAQFRERRVRKEYIALVYGEVEEKEGTIDLPIGPDENSPVPYKRRVNRENGRQAQTSFRVMKRGGGLTLLLLEPFTGRKHQLRVHLAAAGHAVVGDKVYGPDEKYYFKARSGPPDEEDLKELLLPRQALHAFRLTLNHPTYGREMCFEAPKPREFDELLGG